MARVNALLRRAAGHSSPVLSSAGIEINTATQSVRRGDEEIVRLRREGVVE